jgi:hypothetical protein
MIQIISYPIIPFATPGTNLQPDNRNNQTNWLRIAINMMMNRRKAELVKAGVNIDLFHNHDTRRGLNISEYPKIQYQRKANKYYITGINEGVFALEQLFIDCQPTVSIDDQLVLKIGKPISETYNPVVTEQQYEYSLIDWLPMSDDSDKEFAKLVSLAEKSVYLEKRLMNHIANDFLRFLNLEVETTQVKVVITGIESLVRPTVLVEENKHIKNYQPFDITFCTNLPLPAKVCLGNKKTYGFGLVEIIEGIVT